jgi:hypothetical protein
LAGQTARVRMSPVADLVFVWKLMVSSAVIHVPGGLAMVGQGPEVPGTIVGGRGLRPAMCDVIGRADPARPL